MADQKNRGGQKKGKQKPNDRQQAAGHASGGTGERSDADKRKDQQANPDDATRRPTDERR